MLYDLEFLEDHNGRRVAAFGMMWHVHSNGDTDIKRLPCWICWSGLGHYGLGMAA